MRETDHIAETAAAYFAGRVDETPDRRRERESWLAADARHARAYEQMQRLWERAGRLRGDADVQAFKSRQLAALQRSRRFRSGWMGIAAALALLLGGYLLLRPVAPPPVSYATVVGERRVEALVDGSRVVLNTNSMIEVRYGRNRRDIDLRQGEAQFEVAHDAERPFVVNVDGITITALGTRFQVRRDADETLVTLLQGKVEVAQGVEHLVLHPNEQALLPANGKIRVAEVDPAQVSGWLAGWLRFRHAPLDRVVAEANRYSLRKLRLDDPALGGLEISGNFHAGDNASIAAGIAATLVLRVDDDGSDIVLSR